MKIQHLKPMEQSEGSPEREVHSITGLPKEDREKSQINNLTVHLKALEEQWQTKPRVNRRKKIIKIRAEINEINTIKNNSEDKWILELVLWKVKQNSQTLKQTHPEKKREYPNK